MQEKLVKVKVTQIIHYRPTTENQCLMKSCTCDVHVMYMLYMYVWLEFMSCGRHHCSLVSGSRGCLQCGGREVGESGGPEGLHLYTHTQPDILRGVKVSRCD